MNSAKGPIFLYGHSVDITRAPFVQITAGGVMHRVRVLPGGVGHHREDAREEAQHGVGSAFQEERAVTGIVLQDEDAHQKQPREQVERDTQRPVCFQCPTGKVKQQEEGRKGVQYL
jgi:hypothetical protein